MKNEGSTEGSYTFIVVSYNQEQFIMEALESIRYQIDAYGESRNFSLIIADDCSEDDTRHLIDFWLSVHSSLFSKVIRIYQAKNVGTCRNLADALQMIEDETFYSIGGDDVLSHIDIFTEINKHKDIDILACPSIIMESGMVKTDWQSYRAMVAQAGYTKEYVDWAVGLGGTFLTGSKWSNRVNTKEVVEFMSRFGLYDDVPRYYAIWKKMHPVSFVYINKPLMIYRKNDESVSSLKRGAKSSLIDDSVRFYNCVAADSTNCFYKLTARIKGWSMAMRGRPLWDKLRYFSPYYFGKLLFEIRVHRRAKAMFEEFITSYSDNAQAFIDCIHKRAEDEKNNYENSKV